MNPDDCLLSDMLEQRRALSTRRRELIALRDAVDADIALLTTEMSKLMMQIHDLQVRVQWDGHS